jgi:3-oxo-5-alpha-steroid 4-dehydrogenase 1
MQEEKILNILILSWFGLAAVIFISLFFIAAPYGRHARPGWGFALNDRLGWIIMEAAAPVLFFVWYILGPYNKSTLSVVFLVMWEFHYLHRAFIFPFTMRSDARRMTLAVICLGLAFNSVNSYINGRFLYHFSGGYPNEWIRDPRFIVGISLFILGSVINRHSDLILRNLRKAGESGYKIPYGGLYHWISCPNYFGEMVIWLGWAVMTWSLAGVAFAFWTAANLIPRARSHQQWYTRHFPDYPVERKTLLPGIW